MTKGLSGVFRGLTLGCLLAFFNVSCEASSKTLSSEQLINLREMIREDISLKFDDDVRKLKDLAARKGGKAGLLSSAIRSLQMKYYNTSYIIYSCVIDSLATTVDSTDGCHKRKILAMAKTSGLAEYDAAHEKSRLCEMKSRLFEAEVEFPPYDFLKFDGNNLFDFDKLNRCLLE